jgi:hypothetical protein
MALDLNQNLLFDAATAAPRNLDTTKWRKPTPAMGRHIKTCLG